MTLYIASSELVGRRPRISRIRAYSSAFSPRSAHGCSRCGSSAARDTVSRVPVMVSTVGAAASGTDSNLPARWWRPGHRSALGDQPVGDDLEERAYGGLVEVGLVGHRGHTTDEPAQLDALDAVLERALLAEPLDHPVAGPGEDLALGEDR